MRIGSRHLMVMVLLDSGSCRTSVSGLGLFHPVSSCCGRMKCFLIDILAALTILDVISMGRCM